MAGKVQCLPATWHGLDTSKRKALTLRLGRAGRIYDGISGPGPIPAADEEEAGFSIRPSGLRGALMLTMRKIGEPWQASGC